MWYHAKLALVAAAMPVTLIYAAGSTACLALLRATKKRPSAVDVGAQDEDLSGKVVIVTGANAGLGSRTAFHLARMGAKVIMACRSVERGEATRTKMQQELTALKSGDTCSVVRAGTLEVMECNLGDLSSVRAFANAFKSKHGNKLDVLVNNAGVAFKKGNAPTADGLDATFGVNFVGHFLLTTELMPVITSTENARVICVSSVIHHFSKTNWEAAAGGSLGRWSYPESKLAMVLFAKELRRKLAAAGSSATAFAVNPGAVHSTIYQSLPGFMKPMNELMMKAFFLTPDEGSCASVCASSWPLEKLSESDYYQPNWMPFGSYYPCEMVGPFVGFSAAKTSVPEDEPAASAKLWAVSEQLVAAAAGSGRGTARG